ncbi:unnamed protein product [Wickerhamomyces anomalus]
MKSFIRFILSLGVLTTLAASVAVPEADALPWAQANPQAYAAANAYADAYAEAVAIAHPDPEAYALAASADDCASIACHASCGLLIIAGTDCSLNSENTYAGPYNTTCLCSSGSSFLQYYTPCMDCGWTLWKYYGGYVSSALAACKTLSTEPTGTLRCSTTLTDSYTIDTSIQGCSYLGNCPTDTSKAASSSSSSTTSNIPSSTSSSTSITSSTSSSSAITSSTSSSASSAVSSSSAQTVSSITTYTGTTYTVTTDLSFTYSYSPGGETTDCFTTSYHYPTATNNPIDMDFISWDDKHYSTTNYTTYFFLNFTSDQNDVTDIKLITGTDMKTAVLTPDSQIWVNLKQGVYGFVTSAQNNMAAYNLGVLITYKEVNQLLQLSNTDLQPSHLLHLFHPHPTSSIGSSSSSAALSSSVESSLSSVASSVASSDSSATSLASSSTSSFASSIAASSTVSSDLSASIHTSSISSETSSEVSSLPSSSGFESSSATTNALSSESSSFTNSIDSATSSFVSSSAELSSSVSSGSSASVSSSSSSSSSSPASSSPVEPELSGGLVNGKPQWSLAIPAALGPWTSVSLVASKNETESFNYNDAKVLVNGETVSDVTVSVSDDSVTLSFTFTIDESDELSIDFGGQIVGGSSFTALATLTITTPDGRRVVKRAEQSWNLSNTISLDASSVSSASSSAISTSSSVSSSVSSSLSSISESTVSSDYSVPSISSSLSITSSASYANGTSTDVVTKPSTTLVTITSCSEDKCSEVESTAQVTVVTSTHNGVVTTFTTYCPLTTTEQQTTVVTVTSCDENKCSEVPSTAQVSIATTTINGVVTSYTTYCPLTTTPTGYQTFSTSVDSIKSHAESTGITTTVVTVTSCANGVCTAAPSTGKVSVATTTQNGVVSSYTTYGSIDSTDVVTKVVTSTKGGQSEAPKTTDANVITGSNVATKQQESTASLSSSTYVVSTFDAAANMIAGSFIGVLFPFLFI